jgi:hypothetical protein
MLFVFFVLIISSEAEHSSASGVQHAPVYYLELHLASAGRPEVCCAAAARHNRSRSRTQYADVTLFKWSVIISLV